MFFVRQEMGEGMETVLRDLKYGARMLMKSPAFSAVAVLTLALGIGANTAIFSVVNAVLLRPLPFQHPERILLVTESWQGRPGGNVSAGNYVDWAEQSTAFEQMAAQQPASFNLAAAESPERIGGARVTANYFGLFGVQPTLGRVFNAEEDQPGREQVVVLSHAIWKTRFGANREIIGKPIQLDGQPYTVLGVMPPWFDPVANNDEMWVPIAFTPQRRAMHDEHYLIVVGRLKAGVSMQQAQAELDAVAKRQAERFPKDNKDRGIRVMRLDEQLVSGYSAGLYLLLGAVGLVLLIGCANVANLQMARSRTRRKEMAIRAALGAAPGRIVRQLLAENMALSLVGGAAGILLAFWGVTWLVASSPAGVPRLAEARIDAVPLGFAVFATLLSGMLFGLAPALRSTSVDGSEAFKAGGRSSSMGSARDRVRSLLVVSEVALALMLLVGAGLLIRSALALRQVQPGFDPTNVLTGRVALPQPQYTNPETDVQTFRHIAEEVGSIPGVQSAAVVSRAPLGGGHSNGLIAEGRPLDVSNAVDSRFRMISPGYFQTMRVPLKRGRLFDARDNRTATKVSIINETLARTMWPGQDPIGKRFACCESGPNNTPMWHEVVGVVGDVRAWGLSQTVLNEFYLPLEQAPADSWNWIQRSMEVVARSQADPAQLTAEVRRVVFRIAPGVPLYNVGTMEQRIATSLEQSRFNTFLLAVFAAAALLLASVGIYGVLSYSVAQRTHEIGVRMAVGASRANVLRLIMGHGFKLALIGVAVGLAGAVAASRVLATLLYAIKPTDVATFVSVSALLVAVALVASYIPARRATKVDPMVALRYE
jgi:putative ABC transport system permease protein